MANYISHSHASHDYLNNLTKLESDRREYERMAYMMGVSARPFREYNTDNVNLVSSKPAFIAAKEHVKLFNDYVDAEDAFFDTVDRLIAFCESLDFVTKGHIVSVDVYDMIEKTHEHLWAELAEAQVLYESLKYEIDMIPAIKVKPTPHKYTDANLRRYAFCNRPVVAVKPILIPQPKRKKKTPSTWTKK